LKIICICDKKKESPESPPIEPAKKRGEKAMLWNIQAAENLISGDFVEFVNDRDGKLSCKKALELATIGAIAARDIAKGEMLTFDTNGDTKDLTTPQKATS
jgi:hypothetical protein